MKTVHTLMNNNLIELIELLAEDGKRDLDLIERSRRIASIWMAQKLDDKQPDYLKILSIDSQTDHLPKGSVREHWGAEALARADAESSEYEECFKETFENARQGMLEYLSKIMRKN